MACAYNVNPVATTYANGREHIGGSVAKHILLPRYQACLVRARARVHHTTRAFFFTNGSAHVLYNKSRPQKPRTAHQSADAIHKNRPVRFLNAAFAHDLQRHNMVHRPLAAECNNIERKPANYQAGTQLRFKLLRAKTRCVFFDVDAGLRIYAPFATTVAQSPDTMQMLSRVPFWQNSETNLYRQKIQSAVCCFAFAQSSKQLAVADVQQPKQTKAMQQCC